MKLKRTYIKPVLESYSYSPEKGYAATVALQDYILIEGSETRSMLASDEISEYTGTDGQWTTGEWD